MEGVGRTREALTQVLKKRNIFLFWAGIKREKVGTDER
jgi:hypothetical protein